MGQIQFDAIFHFIECFGFPPAAADLGQAGDAGLDAVTGHVGVDLVGVIVVVRDGMRARTDQGHMPLQDVEQLWQFINGGAPKTLMRMTSPEASLYWE